MDGCKVRMGDQPGSSLFAPFLLIFYTYSFYKNHYTHLYLIFIEAGDQTTSLNPSYFTRRAAVLRRKCEELGADCSIRIEKVNKLTCTIISVPVHGSRWNFEVKRGWTGAKLGWMTNREVLFLHYFC